MRIGERTIAFLAVNKNGDEVILDNAPARQGEIWTDERSAHDDEYFSVEDHNSAIVLPKGTIRRLIGRDLKWEGDPISLKSFIDGIKIVKSEDEEEKIVYDTILMIGDASGKEGQFSDSDKKTAENLGCEYMDVDDFVDKYKD